MTALTVHTSDAWPLAEELQTEGFFLRKPRLSDAADIFRNYAQDDEVVRYLMWKKHADMTATEEFLQYCLRRWEAADATPYAIVDKATMQVIGMIELRKNKHCITLGYVLGRAFWGRGAMTEICHLLISQLFKSPEIFRIEALCDVENIASARVMEKVGMLKEGILRSYLSHPNRSSLPRDVYCYAIVR